MAVALGYLLAGCQSGSPATDESSTGESETSATQGSESAGSATATTTDDSTSNDVATDTSDASESATTDTDTSSSTETETTSGTGEDPMPVHAWTRTVSADPDLGGDVLYTVLITNDLVLGAGSLFDTDPPAGIDGWVSAWSKQGDPEFAIDLDGEGPSTIQEVRRLLAFDTGFFVAGARSTEGAGTLDTRLDRYSSSGIFIDTFAADLVPGGNERARSIAAAQNGLVAVGSAITGSTVYDGTIVGIDESGTPTWSFVFDGPASYTDEYNDVAISGSTDVIAAVGSSMDAEFFEASLVTLLSASGSELETLTLPGDARSIARAVVWLDGQFIVGGEEIDVDDPTATVATCWVIDELGSVVVESTLPATSQNSYITALAVGPEGRVWYAGSDGTEAAQVGLVDPETCELQPILGLTVDGFADVRVNAVSVELGELAVGGTALPEGSFTTDAWLSYFTW